MKILVVTTKSPYPLFEGRALRSYHLIREAAEAHEVHLLSFVQNDEDLQGLEHMRSLCKVVVGEKLYFSRARWWLLLDALRELFSRSPLQVMKYRSRALRQRMRQMMAEHHYDLVHLDMVHLAEYFDLCGSLPAMLMVHNVESVILQRRAETETSWARRLYLRYQCRKLARFEAQACRRASRVVAVSELDAQQLRELSGVASITAVPNGVDTRFFSQAPGAPVRPEAPSLVFVGGFSWFPNRDAIVYFCREILPQIAAEVPAVSLTVIGDNTGAAKTGEPFDNPRLRLAGRVDDIRPLVAAAAVYIVPLRIGGGTRLKILDALSMSKAIVATPVGAEGLAVEPGRDIVLADSPQDFARQVIRLLKNPLEARRLGRNGRELAERVYDWRVIGQRLRELYQETGGRG
ncbi:MAG TPA: glycosyltransferase [Ideonella sp.]|nr:glycosyltransferase [Ideonella sp.]